MAGRLVAERDGKVRVARYQSALTYHFGPPLAAAAWPVSLPARLRQPARPGQALAAVGGGFPIAMVVLGAALEAHWLCGPTLLGGGGLAAEEVVLARRVSAEGRTRAYLCGRSAAVGDLREVAVALLALRPMRCHSNCSWAPVNTKSSDATKNGPLPAADAVAMLQSSNAAATAKRRQGCILTSRSLAPLLH